ncbi:MAG: NAD(P)-dependent alcohol dehydrogenase [Actinobacteria bacterium]|nr:NAD(P)-dependent alcohol dehydrogenase [Actinomycetota bacterium]
MADDEILVRVSAASVNPADWYDLTGTPRIARPAMGLFRPKNKNLGVDFAGTVEAVGKSVSQFRVGEAVFGGRTGAIAEYVCVREEKAIVLKPPAMTMEQAAAMPVAALTALQGLRDKGQLQPGQHVLINGASGGVGTYAVQIAKALGAEVTAVCSTRNVDQARALGADHVVDYTVDDFTTGDHRYDLLLDVAGSRRWSDYRKVLKEDATIVIVGAPKGSKMFGPLGHIIHVRLAAMFSSQSATFFVAKFDKADLSVLGDLVTSGKLTSVIDRRYPLKETADAFRYLGEGHAQGKIVVTI